jgi:cyanate permease
MIANSNLRRTTVVIALVCYVILTLANSWLPGWLVFGLIIPGGVATGTFFPLLFEKAAKNPLGVFALDAIGAGLGSLLAAAIPILFGFQVYGYIALLVFAGTILTDNWFHKSDGTEVNPF